ncbi:unnamed protein product [Thlaspi arvense]|uniref:Uncharacterized protein n=1 Tax=Thlaspi arvense TaxID=13288 RepID=A0AAU9RVW2_THLAR|nr:unnamed protein product [Thlaspi arvense]
MVKVSTTQRFISPLVSELNTEMLMRYNDLSGRSPNVKFKGDSPIKEFSLKVKTGVDPDLVDCWIRDVLRRGVVSYLSWAST